MKKLLISALIAGLPGVALADAKADQIAQLKAQLEALQAQMQQLQQAVNAATAAKEADSAAADDANAEMKQRVTSMEMKVDKLNGDSSEGPIAGLSVTGYLDPTYLYNRNEKSAGFQFLNHSNQYSYTNSTFGDVYLDIKKTFGVGPLAPSAEITILPNRGSGNTLMQSSASNGSSTSDSSSSSSGGLGNIINTAVITFPLSDTTSLVGGVMSSFGGYEVQQSNQMNTITHGLLYDFSDPGNYLGAGFNWSHDVWSTKFLIANEQYHTDPNVIDGKSNNTPTVTGRLDWNMTSNWDIGGSFNVGRQTLPPSGSANTYGYQGTASGPYSNYYFGEMDASYTGTDSVYNAEIDYGTQKQAAWNGGDAVWYGFSLLAHQKWTTESFGRMGATLRYDYLNDSKNGGGGGGIALNGTGLDGVNGFGISQTCQSTGSMDCSGANRQALTAALLFYPTDQLTLKVELRHDWASQAVFQRADGVYSKSNDVLAAQAIYTF